jgi:hypothetical protein
MNIAQKQIDRSVKSSTQSNIMNNRLAVSWPSALRPSRENSAAAKLATAGKLAVASLKTELERTLGLEFADVEQRLVAQAINEAAALAALTPVAHLVLPVLAEEKARAARDWTVRQQEIFRRSSFAFAA